MGGAHIKLQLWRMQRLQQQKQWTKLTLNLMSDDGQEAINDQKRAEMLAECYVEHNNVKTTCLSIKPRHFIQRCNGM